MGDFYLVLLHTSTELALGTRGSQADLWSVETKAILSAQVGVEEGGEKPGKGGFGELMSGSVVFLLSPASRGGGEIPAGAPGSPQSCDNIQPWSSEAGVSQFLQLTLSCVLDTPGLQPARSQGDRQFQLLHCHSHAFVGYTSSLARSYLVDVLQRVSQS